MKKRLENIRAWWIDTDRKGSKVALVVWVLVFTVWVSVFAWPIFSWHINYSYLWCVLPTPIALVASRQARSQWGRWLALTLLVAISNSGFFPFMYAVGYTWLVWSRHRYGRVPLEEQGDV